MNFCTENQYILKSAVTILAIFGAKIQISRINPEEIWCLARNFKWDFWGICKHCVFPVRKNFYEKSWFTDVSNHWLWQNTEAILEFPHDGSLPPTIKQKPRLVKTIEKNQAKNGLSLITQRRRRVQRPFSTHLGKRIYWSHFPKNLRKRGIMYYTMFDNHFEKYHLTTLVQFLWQQSFGAKVDIF